MKKLLFIILLLIPFTLNARIQYVNKSGNDGNNGSSYALGNLTSAGAIADAQPEDTLIYGAGTYDRLILANMDGIFSNRSLIIDTLSFADGWSSSDTTWLVIIGNNTDSFPLSANNDSYYDITGLYFLNATSTRLAAFVGTTTNIFLNRCKFKQNESGIDYMVEIEADSLFFDHCLFINHTNNIRNIIVDNAQTAEHVEFDHCTFYGDCRFQNIFFNNGLTVKFRNNIIYNSHNVQTVKIINLYPSSITDINYNIWYSTITLDDSWTITGINDYSTFGAWQTAVQNYDVDGESNSSYQDPLLQNTSSTCYITTDSPAYNAGDDGNSIGYYHPTSTGTPKGTNLIIIQ